MKPITIYLGFLIFIGLICSNCSDDTLELNQDKLIGTWISADRLDTLNFVNNTSFYKNSDHFDYKLAKDSIEIRYSGVLYILVQPSNHHYTLIDNTLTIDFTNDNCYGFESTIQTFDKQ